MNKWISVTDRLPDEWKSVLLYQEYIERGLHHAAKYDELETQIYTLTGHTFIELRDMFAAGWELKPPEHIEYDELLKEEKDF